MIPGLGLALGTALAAWPASWVRPPGNVHPLLAAARPLGPADPGRAMARMILALRLSPGAGARLERTLAELQDSRSPSYHHWLTPEQFGARFGPGAGDLERVTGWLRAGGFSVDAVAAGRLAITFSGTVAQVQRAFRTPIRRFALDGAVRQGNALDPAIPSALAGLVAGVVSLHDLPRPAQNAGFAAPSGHSLTPGDFRAIYNVGPLYREGIDGGGANVDAAIQAPGADRTVADGTAVAFRGAAQVGDPEAALACAWDFGDGSAGTGTACTHTYRNPGPVPLANLVIFTARDGAGAQGSDTRTITVLPAPAPGELIADGGFELGGAGWSGRGVATGDNLPQAPAHQGYTDAWFPPGTDALLRQTVCIPATAGSARLAFWLRIDTRESGPRERDCLEVKARGANGRLVTLGRWSNRDAGPGYQQERLSLDAFRGQRVELSWVASGPAGGPGTGFAVDDVSLIAR